MTIILFGAGASFGSGDVYPYPPPLGNNLFAELKKNYPQWRNLPRNLEIKFEENFEDGMGEVISRYAMATSILMQRMGVYFANFTLRRNSNNLYVGLLKELKNRNKLSSTLLSTLNYECLLELSAYINDIEQSYFDIRPDTANIWKIHGSCNFKYSGMNATREVRMSGYNLNGGFTIVPNLEEVKSYYNGDTSLYPAMCIFAKNKPIHISSNVIQEQINKWQQHIINSNKIIIIGVRPLYEDKHIWDFISKSDAEVIMVGSENEFNKWCSLKRNNKKNRFLGAYWNDVKDLVYELI